MRFYTFFECFCCIELPEIIISQKIILRLLETTCIGEKKKKWKNDNTYNNLFLTKKVFKWMTHYLILANVILKAIHYDT